MQSGTVANLATTILANTIARNTGNGISLILTSGATINANTITTNGGDGVKVDTGTGNSVLSNALFGDGNLEIELVNNGNNSQPAPVLTSVTSSGGSTTIAGTLQAAPGTSYASSSSPAPPPVRGPGAGETLLNGIATLVMTDSTGLAVINVTLPVTVAASQFLTATATNQTTGDTSAFSMPGVLSQVSISGATVIASSGGTTTATFTVSLSAPSAAGERDVCHRRRHRQGGRRLRRLPPTVADFAPGPGRADRHGHGQPRAGRRVPSRRSPSPSRTPPAPPSRAARGRARSLAPLPCRRS